MPGVLEGVVFAHFITPFEVYERLVDLDERIVMRWILPGKPGASEIGPPGMTKYRVWVRPKNSTNVKILGGGHLVCSALSKEFFFVKVLKQIPQEAPQELGMFVFLFFFSDSRTICFCIADDLNNFILRHFQTTLKASL